MTIKSYQLTAYDEASKAVERAADILDEINVARLNADHREALADLISQARKLRHELFSAAYDRFLHNRGYRPE